MSELDVAADICHTAVKCPLAGHAAKAAIGREFLGASAKAAPSSSSRGNTFVNYVAFEEDEDPVTFVGKGGA